MSKSKNGPTRKLTEKEVEEHARHTLETIRQICTVYDGGNAYIAFTLATEVSKFLTTTSNVKVRGTKKFPTLQDDYSNRNLLSEHKLIATRCYAGDNNNRPRMECHPAYLSTPYPVTMLSFRDWWNHDVIYRASAAPRGWTPLTVPARPEDQVPYDKRQTIVRRIFVEMTRNKFGAHLDAETPELLDNLQRTESLGIIFAVNLNGSVFNNADGSLGMVIGPAAAMMRQIAHEMLAAYGVADAAEESKSSPAG
jgi:hypothetical protein